VHLLAKGEDADETYPVHYRPSHCTIPPARQAGRFRGSRLRLVALLAVTIAVLGTIPETPVSAATAPLMTQNGHLVNIAAQGLENPVYIQLEE
jgi:hypothetical protein